MATQAKFGFVLEYVTDVEAARRFYEDILGVKAERAHPVFVQFDHFAIASDQSMSGTREPETYWLVENAEAAFTDLSQRVEITQPLRQMPFGKVFGIKDPAGETVFMLEFAQNRPSEVVK